MLIRILKPNDWSDVKDIYELGIATGIATFENQVSSWVNWDKSHLTFGKLIAEIDQQVVGWVALSPVSDRCVYGGVAEVSIYVHPDFKSQGIGKSLMREAIKESEQNGIWTLNAATFPENVGSLSLLKKVGFREIGFREKIAKKDGTWKDNVILERRSSLLKYS
jgi:L-amino acid N-acyltransferase YncA